jgi:hypothetical protein
MRRASISQPVRWPPPALPSADTAAVLFWALRASGQINTRKVDGSQTLATKAQRSAN